MSSVVFLSSGCFFPSITKDKDSVCIVDSFTDSSTILSVFLFPCCFFAPVFEEIRHIGMKYVNDERNHNICKNTMIRINYLNKRNNVKKKKNNKTYL
jgi:hypothetical protein